MTEQQIESSEAKVTSEALLRDNVRLQKELAGSEASSVILQKHLASATSEAEVLKRKVTELILRFEALGLGATVEAGRVEQRLLQAISDLRVAETARNAFQNALAELHQAAARYKTAATTADAEASLIFEAALRGASKVLSDTSFGSTETSDPAVASSEGMVIAVKDELALIVASIGRRHGIKVGMPLRVLRDGVELGTVRVVDVREKVAGAVVQDIRSPKNTFQVGDLLKVDTER